MKIFLLLILFITPLKAFEIPLDEMLKKHVKLGEKRSIKTTLINYNSWKADPRHEQIKKQLLSEKPSLYPVKDKMAFWINAYNFLAIDIIIKSEERGTIRNQGSIIDTVWHKHKWVIEEKPISLHEIEHNILRKMNEPRIHFALVCASLSCPDLRIATYKGSYLDIQLEDATKAFLNNETKGISADGRISKIFDWYKQDFGGNEGVKKFVANYSKITVKATLDYDWALNGSW